MNIAVSSGLSDKKLFSKLEPLLVNDKIDKIFLYRKTALYHNKINNRLTNKKLNNISFELYRIKRLILDSFKYKFGCYVGIFIFMHGISAFFVSKLFNKPLVQILPGSDVRYIIEKKRFVFLIKWSDFIITRGRITNNELIQLGVKEDKMYIIPNLFEFNNIKRNALKQEYELISVGSLINTKRLDILLRSIKLVSSKYNMNKIKVSIVGDGPLLEELRKLSEDLGIENNVVFLGYQKDVNKLFQQSKIFIMTTEYEGQPQAMIEALAHGIPCIMPEITNIPEIAINDYNSIIVKPLDVQGFTEAIYKLSTDDRYYKKLKKGAEKFKEEHEYEYSMENVSNLWNDIITEIIKKNKRKS